MAAIIERIFISRFKCWLGYHDFDRYSYETRTWKRTKKSNRHLYHEFRLECRFCNKKTKWYRWRRFNEISENLGLLGGNK